MFSFFKLPLFPLLDIVQMWSLKEIIMFSMTSNRSCRAMRTLLKYIRYSNQINVEMSVSSTLHRIIVFSTSEQCHFQVESFSWLRGATASEQILHGSKYLLVKDSDEFSLKTYWENEDLAIKMIYDHLRNLFEKPITSLNYSPSNENMYLELLSYILDNQNRIPNCSVGFLESSEKDAASVLSYLQNVQKLNLSYTVLNYDLSKFKLHNIVIEDGEVMSFQKLTQLDFESLDLYQLYDTDNNLQNEQLNTFLRLWVTGFYPRMKNFRLETQESLVLPKILKTIDFELSEDRMEIDDEDTVLTGGPLNIRRLSDGKLATVYTMDFWNENGQQMAVFEFSVHD